MTKTHKIIFLLITFIAFGLRFYRLGSFPVSPNWDEISHGVNALSLLQTGKDQWSQPWPIFNFRAYGDYPTTLNMYLTMPLIAFFGLNVWTIRLPSAFLGFLTVIISYFLTYSLTKNRKLSLLTMFFMALSPWTLFPSRAVFQSTVAQFFLITGIWLTLKSFDKHYYLLPGLLFWVLSGFAYHNTRIVFLPLFLVFLIIYRHQFKLLFSQHRLFTFLVLILFIINSSFLIANYFNPSSQARSRWVFIINPATINEIEQNRNQYTGPDFLSRLLYNRPLYFLKATGLNFLNFFNPMPLFIQGTTNYQFNIPRQGIMYLIWLPFYYFGIFQLISKIKKNQSNQFILAWFILGLVPAIITHGDFPLIRAMTVLPLPLILIALGFNRLSAPLLKLAIFATVISSIFYLKLYFVDYARQYSQSWQYGYRSAVEYIKQNYAQYDQIIFTKKYGEPHEFILFYWPWDMAAYQQDKNLSADYYSDWYWVDSFDKFQFQNDWEIKKNSENPLPRTLLITSSGNYNQSSYRLIKSIYFRDGSVAFDIVTND